MALSESKKHCEFPATPHRIKAVSIGKAQLSTFRYRLPRRSVCPRCHAKYNRNPKRQLLAERSEALGNCYFKFACLLAGWYFRYYSKDSRSIRSHEVQLVADNKVAIVEGQFITPDIDYFGRTICLRVDV